MGLISLESWQSFSHRLIRKRISLHSLPPLRRRLAAVLLVEQERVLKKSVQKED
jgi:hypothetical protein